MEQMTQYREGLRIEYNVTIPARDGNPLKANIYFPEKFEGKLPVILTYGIYSKDLHFEEIYSSAWNQLLKSCPEVGVGSTNIHQAWEVVDPEKWCPDGYAIVRVDSRGTGCSPGFCDPYSETETWDIYDCIEWCAAQEWCSGKIGMCGISLYAVNAWQVAEKNPPHLAAIVAWEGWTNWYRDNCRHGGIMNVMQPGWQNTQTNPVQYGKGDYGFKSRATGLNVSGDVTLTEEELMHNRVNHAECINAHQLDDEWFKSHTVRDLKNITIPVLSAGNWGGQGLHLQGNVEGYMGISSKEKFLELHCGEHWTMFYAQEGMDLQKQFLGYYLKGEDTGWKERPPVELAIRYPGNKWTKRFENEFPLARTKYTKLYLDPVHYELSMEPFQGEKTVSYKGMSSKGVTFMTPPLDEDVEITGFSRAKLRVSSSTTDADLFLVLRAFSPDMEEVWFAGANDPHTPLGQGWLRVSHRKLDETKSTDFRPWLSHDELQPMTPGEPVDVDIAFYPTNLVIPKGYRLALSIRGTDYEYPGADGSIKESNCINASMGCGTNIHTDPIDRPPAIFDGEVTLHFDSEHPSYIQIPVIPEK